MSELPGNVKARRRKHVRALMWSPSTLPKASNRARFHSAQSVLRMANTASGSTPVPQGAGRKAMAEDAATIDRDLTKN